NKPAAPRYRPGYTPTITTGPTPRSEPNHRSPGQPTSPGSTPSPGDVVNELRLHRTVTPGGPALPTGGVLQQGGPGEARRGVYGAGDGLLGIEAAQVGQAEQCLRADDDGEVVLELSQRGGVVDP